MKKIINILILLFCMNATAYTQNFNLTENGLMQIQIGDTINLQGKISIKPVRQGKDFLEISFWGTEYFDYYYIEHTGRNITLDSAVVVKDIFLYVEKTKGKEVSGIFLSVSKQYDSLLVSLLNRVFGPLQLEASTGSADEKWRVKRLWAKEQIRVFVTNNYSDLLRVHISPTRDDPKAPGISFRN